MRLKVYVIGNRVIVPTVSRAKAGYYLETEPVATLDLNSPTLPATLTGFIERGTPEVDTPSRANFPKPVVLRYANVKSWKRFSEIADLWELHEHSGNYELARAQKDSDGAYWGGKARLKIPLDSRTGHPDANAVVDAILNAYGSEAS